jgi:hypothetical protein
MGIKRAERIAKVGESWRIYFPAFALGSKDAKKELREWVRNNVHRAHLKDSHIRFYREDDALMFWLAYR